MQQAGCVEGHLKIQKISYRTRIGYLQFVRFTPTCLYVYDTSRKQTTIFSVDAAPITGSVSKAHVASTLHFFVKLTSIICHQVDVVVSVILSSTSCSEAYMREPHNGGTELFSAWDCLREPYAPTAKPRHAGRFRQPPPPIQPVLQDFR